MKGPKLALALFLAVISVASGAAKHKHDAATTAPPPPKATPDNRGTEQQPISVKGTLLTTLPPPTEEQIRAESAKAKDDHSLSVATVWLAGLTAVLALIAAVQAGLFIWQLRLTEKAARDAETAAKAAKASAEALPKIERAYVFVEVTGLHLTRTAGGASRVDADVTFKNHGKTPAIVRRLRAYSQWTDSAPEELINAENAEELMPEGMVIGADKDLVIGQMRLVVSLCREGVEPSGLLRKVSIHYIGCPPFPGLSWRYGM